MRKLVKRIYYAMRLHLETPLCISNGESQLTDSDILRTWDGKPFIPGTSFAGAFRTFCKNADIDGDAIFGTSRNDSLSSNFSRMSPLWISDFFFDTEVTTDIRDGVKLKDKISVDGAKYDYEILEYGSGILYLQLCIWDDMDEKKSEDIVRKIAGGINTGDIRFGGNKNRGLGKMDITEIYVRKFTADNVEEWIDFSKDNLINSRYRVNIEDWCINAECYITINIPLELTGGISIRQYSKKVNGPDFMSLMRNTEKHNEMPVIPGSSWKGAIRDRMETILKELGVEESLRNGCEDMFGYVKEAVNSCDKAKASEVMVTESILKDNGFVESIRNKISRFENTTVDGELYKERFAVKGKTCLEIKVKKNNKNTEWFIGLILLAVEDIQKGYLSIGGGAAVGRGIFKEDGTIEIKNGLSKQQYIVALREKVLEVA